MSVFVDFARLRSEMVARQIRARGVTDERVLEALRRVPRHEFVPEELWGEAYADHPLPIGCGQTISQPYIVAYMSAALAARPGACVLEVGTGSGYQTAVLCAMGLRVLSLEVVPELRDRAQRTLERLGFDADVRLADGHDGAPSEAPFDGVIVTAAARDGIPPALVEQLAEGGRIVAPVGDWDQILRTAEKRGGALRDLDRLLVRFVPLVRGLHGARG
jgi:protein-L-isoaspartate(D-aspartate) O-methyltransferase